MNDIFDAQKHYRRIQFFVKWKEHDENRNWYNFDEFRNATNIVKNFYNKCSNKSRFDWLKQKSN